MTDYPVDAGGNVQVPMTEGDVIPREIAVKTDDPPHIVDMIKMLNTEKYSAAAFVKIIAVVDAARKEYHGRSNPDLAEPDETPK